MRVPSSTTFKFDRGPVIAAFCLFRFGARALQPHHHGAPIRPHAARSRRIDIGKGWNDACYAFPPEPPQEGIMSRTRRTFLKAGITAGAAGTALGFPMIARAQQSFNWKMTSAYAKGAPFYMD